MAFKYIVTHDENAVSVTAITYVEIDVRVST